MLGTHLLYPLMDTWCLKPFFIIVFLLLYLKLYFHDVYQAEYIQLASLHVFICIRNV